MHPVEHQPGQRHPLLAEPLHEVGRLAERVALRGGILLLNDCYNANPISMRAALDALAPVGVDLSREIDLLTHASRLDG